MRRGRIKIVKKREEWILVVMNSPQNDLFHFYASRKLQMCHKLEIFLIKK